MALCHICNKRPARRKCPAVASDICAICCARDRMIDLACPVTCGYLISAREHAKAREGQIISRQFGEMGLKLNPNKVHMTLGIAIDEAIVAIQRETYKDIDDSEILAAIDNAIKNIETAGTGLIYEHKDGSKRVQELSHKMRTSLDEVVAKFPAENRPRSIEILEAFKLIGNLVRAHIRSGEDKQAYLRYIALFHAWDRSETGGAARIVLA